MSSSPGVATVGIPTSVDGSNFDKVQSSAVRDPARWYAWEAVRFVLTVAITSAVATTMVVRTTAADPPTPSTAHLALRKEHESRDPVSNAPIAMFSDAEYALGAGDALSSRGDHAPVGFGAALQASWSSSEAREHGEDAPRLPSAELETLGTLFNIHTGEVIPLSSEEPTLGRFSNTLSDRTTGAEVELDPRLLDLLRHIAKRNPLARIELVSGYRSPKLNEMLRKKGHNVASHSQHSLGHACDFRIVGLTPAQMKQEVLALGWQGGIGRYDKRSDWFVHADVGPKRQWYGGR